MEQQPHRACERTKSKQKQNEVTSHLDWPRVLLFNLAHKQYNGIIKGWLQCLTSESKGRFLDNDILFGSAWCLVMAQIQFSLIKNRDWTSRTLDSHPSPTFANRSFLPSVSPLYLFKFFTGRDSKQNHIETPIFDGYSEDFPISQWNAGFVDEQYLRRGF